MRVTFNAVFAIVFLGLVLSCGMFNSEDAGGANSSNELSESASQTDSNGVDVSGGGQDSGSEDAPESSVNRAFTVKFEKGKTSRSYKNSIGRGGTHTYSLGASKGQMMRVSIRSNKRIAAFEVRDPAGNRLDDGDPGVTVFGRTLPANGNYKITVIGPTGSDDYTVDFGVTGKLPTPEIDEPPAGGIVTTVKFSKGKTTASYKNAVIRGERNTYILGAKGGQLMTVSITSIENNAVFQIKGPSGYLRDAAPGDDTMEWSGQLPADGKYRVIVGGTRGNATYTVNFAIR